MSARPRPVTATFPPPCLDSPLRPRFSDSYPLSRNSSTASLVSVLNHDSYESFATGLYDDSRGDERRSAEFSSAVGMSAGSGEFRGRSTRNNSSAPYRSGRTQSNDRVDARRVRPIRLTSYAGRPAPGISNIAKPGSARQAAVAVAADTDSVSNGRGSYNTARSRSKEDFGRSDGDTTGEMEATNDQRRTAWERWVVEKAREHRKKADQELAAQRAKEEAETKAKAAKEANREKGVEAIRRWVEERTAAEVRQHRMEAEMKRKEEEKKKAEKEKIMEKAGKAYEEWKKKKDAEDTKRQEEAKKREQKAKEEKEKKIRRNEEAFSKWAKAAQNRPKTAPSSYGYSSGKLTGYYDTGAYPIPSFINPIPWKPLDISNISAAAVGGKKYEKHSTVVSRRQLLRHRNDGIYF